MLVWFFFCAVEKKLTLKEQLTATTLVVILVVFNVFLCDCACCVCAKSNIFSAKAKFSVWFSIFLLLLHGYVHDCAHLVSQKTPKSIQWWSATLHVMHNACTCFVHLCECQHISLAVLHAYMMMLMDLFFSRVATKSFTPVGFRCAWACIMSDVHSVWLRTCCEGIVVVDNDCLFEARAFGFHADIPHVSLQWWHRRRLSPLEVGIGRRGKWRVCGWTSWVRCGLAGQGKCRWVELQSLLPSTRDACAVAWRLLLCALSKAAQACFSDGNVVRAHQRTGSLYGMPACVNGCQINISVKAGRKSLEKKIESIYSHTSLTRIMNSSSSDLSSIFTTCSISSNRSPQAACLSSVPNANCQHQDLSWQKREITGRTCTLCFHVNIMAIKAPKFEAHDRRHTYCLWQSVKSFVVARNEK